MELKDVILSTLAEMEDVNPVNNTIETKTEEIKEEVARIVESEEKTPDNEMLFLTSIRERLLVLFEGFQAPNNTNIEAKVDMTLNFLEYVLVTIDSRVAQLEKGHRDGSV